MKQSIDLELKNYIEIAACGTYPLFFTQWLEEYEQKPIALRQARKNVRDMFKSLSKHRTLQKKQTVMLSQDKKTRDMYINSFIRLAEQQNLNRTEFLQ